MRRLLVLLLVAAVTVGPALGPGLAPAEAADGRPLFQLPFPCGERWEGVTRENHDPNYHSLDMYYEGGPEEGRLIIASAPGTIRKSEYQPAGAGWLVSIWHANGWGTSYMHLLEKPLVEKGQQVDLGTPLGRVGSTGASGAPHLHYQQWNNSHPDNTVESHFNGVPSGVRPGQNQTFTSHNCGSPQPDLSTRAGSAGVTYAGEFWSFHRRLDDHVVYHVENSGAGWTHHDLDGSVASAPSAVVHNGDLWVVARGTDNLLWYRTSTPESGWTSVWRTAPGGITGNPALLVFDQRMFVFARSGDGVYYRVHHAANGWDQNGWRSLDQPAPGVAAASDPVTAYFDGRMFVAVRGSDGNVYVRGFNGAWSSAWTKLTGATTGTPALVSHENRTLFVFARSPQGDVRYHDYDRGATSWTLDRALAGDIEGSPAAISFGGLLTVSGRNAAGELVYRNFSGSWTGWLGLGKPSASVGLDSSPIAMRYGASRIVGARGTNRQLYIRSYRTGWSGWTVLPGSHAPMP